MTLWKIHGGADASTTFNPKQRQLWVQRVRIPAVQRKAGQDEHQRGLTADFFRIFQSLLVQCE
jgi:hypothetical protein